METLEPRQEHTMALLTGGQGVDEICKALNIQRTTLWRWHKQPEFIAGWNQMV